ATVSGTAGGLVEGNAYSMWASFINLPHKCTGSPEVPEKCTIVDFSAPEIAGANYGGIAGHGGIADANGELQIVNLIISEGDGAANGVEPILVGDNMLPSIEKAEL